MERISRFFFKKKGTRSVSARSLIQMDRRVKPRGKRFGDWNIEPVLKNPVPQVAVTDLCARHRRVGVALQVFFNMKKRCEKLRLFANYFGSLVSPIREKYSICDMRKDNLFWTCNKSLCSFEQILETKKERERDWRDWRREKWDYFSFSLRLLIPFKSQTSFETYATYARAIFP